MFESGIELKLADCLFCLNIRKRDMEANGWICWKQGFDLEWQARHSDLLTDRSIRV